MRKRQTNFICILLVSCLLVYLTIQYFGHSSKTENTESSKQRVSERIARVPSIIVYAREKEVDAKDNCSQQYDTEKISILWDGDWQKVNEESLLFLYSAYVDRRPNGSNHYLRIMAMSKGIIDEIFLCRIWHNKTSSVVSAGMEELWLSKWDSAKPHEFYRPLLLSCPFQRSWRTPTAVAVITEPCVEPNNIFLFNETHFRVNSSNKADFAVCVKPLDYQNDRSLRLLEWLELQYLLGANKITIYTYYLPRKMFEVLKKYQKRGKIFIKEHMLPGDSPSEPDERRMFLAKNVWQKRRHEMLVYNDCFYRHIDTHRYVVNLDLDEAIIPLVDTDWKSLFKRMNTLNPKMRLSAAISAPNVYFFNSFGTDSNDTIPKYFHMLRHLYRSANFTPPGFAQKSFFSTDYTLSVSNHYALKALYSNVFINVSGKKDLLHLHHYRAKCPPKMDAECAENYMKFRVKDSTILRFKDSLMKNIFLKMKEFNLTDPHT